MFNLNKYVKHTTHLTKGLSLFFFLLIYGILSMLQPASATILVTAGSSQNVPAGSTSADIVFNVIDEQGTPNTGATVNFTLTNSAGNAITEDGLTVYTATTDDDGQVTTRLKEIDTIGNYLVTATLATDSSQSVNTNIIVVANTANMSIVMISGGSQKVPAGSQPANIIFSVTDSQGKPSVGTTVNFTLLNPTGSSITQNGLTVYTAKTDESGQVSTRLNETGTIGNYTVTATLAANTSKFDGTNIVVVASTAAKLTVTAGADQTIYADKLSARIDFKLSDNFDNAVSKKVINFQEKNPDGEIADSGLSTIMATTDVNGKVTVYLKPTNATGIFTIIATLITDDTVTAEAIITVTEALPQLPSLGFGAAFNNKGEQVDSNAIFHGGTSVNDDDFNQELVLNVGEPIVIKGLITVDSTHIGQSADIIIVVGYKLIELETVEVFFMFDNNRVIQPWDGILDNLLPVERVASLPKNQTVKIYEAQLEEGVVGRLRIYFGYRLDDGVVVFNASQVISLLIK